MAQVRRILPVIVFAQFCCTSLWFAGNGVMNDLIQNFHLHPAALGHLTSAVQFGFIIGTLTFAFLNIADRYSPSKVFFYSALFGALFNLGITWDGNSGSGLLLLRFLTGLSLAGIYPVGMKIASDYYRTGLGNSLGFLVGALVIGTAFPHLARALTGTEGLPWKLVLYVTSAMAAAGGTLVLLLVPDGPYRRAMVTKDYSAFFAVFKKKSFRAAAFGYFGHMWELYAFWAFVPFILALHQELHSDFFLNISLMSFAVIAAGGIACVAGGFISTSFGTKRTAATALFLSGLCCLFSPFFLFQDSGEVLLIFLIFWGMVVVADSPLFSTLVAQKAPEQSRGTALTIVNSIGFAITILSIQLLNYTTLLLPHFYILLFLAPGPALGLFFLLKKRKKRLQ